MNNSTLKTLCADLHNGIISEKKAMSAIFTSILHNKAFFGLKTLDDDEMSDFLLYIFENIRKSFYTYNIQKSSFLTYVQNIIRLNLKSWIRIRRRVNSVQRYVLNYSKNEYSEDDSEPLYFSEQNDSYNISSKCKTGIDKIQLLAVALKASYFLTPQHITALSCKTGYHEDYIWKLKKNIDEHMKDKYLKNEARIEKVNKSYFFRQRALDALSMLTKNHPYYLKVYRTFQFHDKNWKNRRDSVQYRTVVPVNSYIARLLNVSESVINRAIAKAKRNSPGSSSIKS